VEKSEFVLFRVITSHQAFKAPTPVSLRDPGTFQIINEIPFLKPIIVEPLRILINHYSVIDASSLPPGAGGARWIDGASRRHGTKGEFHHLSASCESRPPRCVVNIELDSLAFEKPPVCVCDRDRWGGQGRAGCLVILERRSVSLCTPFIHMKSFSQRQQPNTLTSSAENNQSVK
jgi:hypothetical protein